MAVNSFSCYYRTGLACHLCDGLVQMVESGSYQTVPACPRCDALVRMMGAGCREVGGS